jgi:hypothetical protein
MYVAKANPESDKHNIMRGSKIYLTNFARAGIDLFHFRLSTTAKNRKYSVLVNKTRNTPPKPI